MKQIFYDIILYFIEYIPSYIGMLIRSFVYRKMMNLNAGQGLKLDIGVAVVGHKNISIGNNASIMRFSSLYSNKGSITIGKNLSANSNSSINSSDGGTVIIGDNVLIGPNVVIRASDHNFAKLDIPINAQGHAGGKIIIGDNVWIGANAVITKNVSIGNNSIIGAGSIVTKDVEANSIYAGNPAKKIKERTA